jgi:hypothetical protein
MDTEVIIVCGIFLAIVAYLVYAKPWKNEEFIAADEQEAKAAVEEVKAAETVAAKTEEIFAKVVEEATKLDKEVGEVLKEVVATVEPVKEEAPVVVVEKQDALKPKRGKKGKK